MDKTTAALAQRLNLSSNGMMKDWVNRLEGVRKRMTMVVGQEAGLAQVEVGTILASDEAGGGQLVDATVAGALLVLR